MNGIDWLGAWPWKPWTMAPSNQLSCPDFWGFLCWGPPEYPALARASGSMFNLFNPSKWLTSDVVLLSFVTDFPSSITRKIWRSHQICSVYYIIYTYIYIPYHYINLNKGILLTIARLTDPKKMWSFKICIDCNEPRGRCPGVVGRPVAWLVGWFNHCCCLDPCR